MQKWEWNGEPAGQEAVERVRIADTVPMFETFTPPSSKMPAAGMAAAPVRPGQLPLELELEFAEMQASAASGGALPALLGSTLLFHALLIAERASLALPPRAFAMRGGPVTLLLLGYLLLPATFRKGEAGRAFFALFAVLLVAALLGGVPYVGAGQLLPMQTGVAALLLLLGWLTALPRFWMFATAAGALLTDAALLLLGPAAHTAGLPVIFESFWAPGCAAALLLLLAGVRHSEARRDFLMLRQAAFAGVGGAPAEVDSRHLDPQTGVAGRAAFDMRFRAAWDNAAARRSSVALLFFSIDNLQEHKRDLGFKTTELLQAQVASILKDGLRRADDMVARFDHQHFVVMMPGVGMDGSAQIGERLRGCVEDMRFLAGQKRRPVTVTVGTASLRAKRSTPREKLIDCAVQALEQGRATGTNLVCVEGRGCIPRMS